MAVVHPDELHRVRGLRDELPLRRDQPGTRDGKKVAEISAATCKGCGGCVPLCGQDAIDLLGHTDEQMLAAIDSFGEALVP